MVGLSNVFRFSWCYTTEMVVCTILYIGYHIQKVVGKDGSEHDGAIFCCLFVVVLGFFVLFFVCFVLFVFLCFSFLFYLSTTVVLKYIPDAI